MRTPQLKNIKYGKGPRTRTFPGGSGAGRTRAQDEGQILTTWALWDQRGTHAQRPLNPEESRAVRHSVIVSISRHSAAGSHSLSIKRAVNRTSKRQNARTIQH